MLLLLLHLRNGGLAALLSGLAAATAMLLLHLVAHCDALAPPTHDYQARKLQQLGITSYPPTFTSNPLTSSSSSTSSAAALLPSVVLQLLMPMLLLVVLVNY